MYQAKLKLKGTAPLSFSKATVSERNEGESHAAHEERVWRERMHTKNGNVVIPGMMFKKSIETGGAALGKIQGKGMKTWTKPFISGVRVTSGTTLDINPETVEGEWIFVPSDGVKGSGKRVNKCFPVIPNWEGEITVLVLDPEITEKVLLDAVARAGLLVGVGRFRPEKGGDKGTFKCTSCNIEEIDMEAS